ncbi:MAG TPA: hypothetical protein VJ743_19635 [Albitalea sp.]|nr:hypothetical protein [Albitalea sp.]
MMRLQALPAPRLLAMPVFTIVANDSPTAASQVRTYGSIMDKPRAGAKPPLPG